MGKTVHAVPTVPIHSLPQRSGFGQQTGFVHEPYFNAMCDELAYQFSWRGRDHAPHQYVRFMLGAIRAAGYEITRKDDA